MSRHALAEVRGFSLIELTLTVAVAATLMAIALPTLGAMSDATKLSNAAQQVERELQTARTRAVSKNRTVRLWTNCPQTGYYRIVERLGTGADTTKTRCEPSTYPWPSNTDLASPPNYDGPVRQMINDATVSDAWLEFRPDGSAWTVVSGSAIAIATPVTVTVTRKSTTKTITVNELGKILLQ
jgi:prepilin-type N-terminal cleavage/methylation domain-containing protein